MFTSRKQVLQFCTRQFHHIVSTQTIKLSIPNHHPRLSRYNLSFMDKICPWVYIPFIFHYPNDNTRKPQDSVARCLKNSLSPTLTQYYPFAGRLDTTLSYVDCNDEGIEFQEVNIESRLSEFIKKPEHQVQDFLYPKHEFTCQYDSPLLVVRLYHFQCGGISILVGMSHKLGDAASFMTFMKSWAINTQRISNNLGSNEEVIMGSPYFESHKDGFPFSNASTRPNSTVRKFVFPNSEIAKLKAKTDDSSTTRVEALASLLFKRAIATASSLEDSDPVTLVFFVNMRSHMIPPLPETSIGNFLWSMEVVIRDSNEKNFKVIVEKIKAAKVGIRGMTKWDDIVERTALQVSQIRNIKYFICSSLCGLKFNEIDFGWGNPYRVTAADTVLNKMFTLMDTPTGDGIEAIVGLDEHHMNLFQYDHQILAFTSS